MIRNLFISFLLTAILIRASCQAISYPLGGAAVGCGHTSLCRTGLWSTMNNQGASAALQTLQAGVFMENRYMVAELNRIAIAAFIPLKGGGLSLSIDHFGGALYSEMKTGLSYSLTLGGHLSAGIQLDHLMMSIGEGYGSHHSITFEAGILASITDNFKIGLHAFNPIIAKWYGTDENIPVSYRGGFAYKPEQSLELFAEVHKSTTDAAIFCAGAEYIYHDKFYFRAGITSGPARYTFGAGIKLSRIRLDIASSVHAWLGYSPQISFTYQFGK